ncbi:MAG: hypothetical protein UW24_C0021G0013 [Parcubacteria group bacterium GW2011_GWA2_44_12]|nr:MAG: hypothetical protein UW24_C0021G0013 [Parcubacteria group bacterium GW2011_GWA2_44_12]
MTHPFAYLAHGAKSELKLYLTATFDKGYRRLPLHIQKQVDKKLALFVEQGQGHASLRFKIFQKYKEEGIYENLGYEFYSCLAVAN